MQRPEISGTTCPKSGAQRTWKKSKFVCVALGKRRVWIQTVTSTTTTTTVVQAGTFSNPIRKGSIGRDKDIEVIVLGSSWNAGNEVCAANFYNDGCTYDSNFDGIADPNSTVHWVRVDLSLKNIGSKLINVRMDYTYAVSLGGRLYGENDFVASIDSINEVQFLPGSSVNTSFYVAVPKSVGTANLLFLIRPYGGNFAYFATQ
jgi:hypothetical protein